ncbi:hypothetical protein AWB70_01758 [Caballeronia cordobensis]|uniref:DUF2934 domain-containing protein n=1 Tax=Caballeronia cordobensis TaxID=1353886 RepID=A0A158GD22_CABCO|nr:DUF2934 domain-containing protein [Caballeronia cordobensis]SAL29549.1 hypothetical protein AWB70_01758 [Caballeronia cordobensis]
MDEQKEQDRIRRRAYELWEREGSPEGRAEEFWQQAIESLGAEDASGTGGEQSASTDSDGSAGQGERPAEEKSATTTK